MARRDLPVSLMTMHVAALMLTAAFTVALPVTLDRPDPGAWPMTWKMAYARDGGGDDRGGGGGDDRGGGGGDDRGGGGSGSDDHGGNQGNGGGSDDRGGGQGGGGGDDNSGPGSGDRGGDDSSGPGSDDHGGGRGSDDSRQADDRGSNPTGSVDRDDRRGRSGRNGADDRPAATVRLSDDELADVLRGERVLVDDRGRELEVDIELEQGRRTVTVKPHGGDARRNPGPIKSVRVVATPPRATHEVQGSPRGAVDDRGAKSGPTDGLAQVGDDLSPQEESELIGRGWR